MKRKWKGIPERGLDRSEGQESGRAQGQGGWDIWTRRGGDGHAGWEAKREQVQGGLAGV